MMLADGVGRMTKSQRILVLEDDDLQYELYQEALEGYELVRATSAREGVLEAGRNPPHLIVLDHILDQGERGLDFLGQFKELLPHVPVVIVSGVLEVEQQMSSLQGPRRAHYCLAKPVDLDVLRRTVATALSECGEAEVLREFESLERTRRVDIELLLSRSTDRLSRQTEIRELVGKDPGRPNVSALARRFKVARRTIIRDLNEMIRRGELDSSIYPKWEA